MDLIKKCTTFLLDCDGVLWRSGQTIQNSVEAVKMLREKNRKIAFVTNNSRTTRSQFVEKLTKFGFEPHPSECFCTSYTTAIFLKSLGFNKSVYVVGEPGLAEELNLHGFKTYMTTNILEWSEKNIEKHEDVGAVVVGLDCNFHYSKLAMASLYLQDPNVMFVATNIDAAIPVSHGRIFPGAGTMVAAVKTSSRREPRILGKPSDEMFQLLKSELGINPEETCMVGDRIETDIMFGAKSGMKTVLVLTGVNTLQDYKTNEEKFLEGCPKLKDIFAKPDYISENLYEMVKKL